jgi:hypothetical protein
MQPLRPLRARPAPHAGRCRRVLRGEEPVSCGHEHAAARGQGAAPAVASPRSSSAACRPVPPGPARRRAGELRAWARGRMRTGGRHRRRPLRACSTLSGQGHRSPCSHELADQISGEHGDSRRLASSLHVWMSAAARQQDSWAWCMAAAAAAGTPPPEASGQGVWSVYDPWWQRRCGCPSACRLAAGQQLGARGGGWANVSRWLAGYRNNILYRRARVSTYDYRIKYRIYGERVPGVVINWLCR